MALEKSRRSLFKYSMCFTTIAAVPFFLGKYKKQETSAAVRPQNKSNHGVSSDEDFLIVDGWMVHVDQIKTRLSDGI